LQRVSSKGKVPAIKYLGVYFDENLDFKYHINTISNKLSRALYSLRTVKKILTSKALKTLYYSLFHCHLTYAIEIWSSTSPSFLQPLITKQKAAIQIIAKKKYNDHTEPLFKSLSIPPLPDLITLFNLKLFYSFHFNYIPKAFINTWIAVRQKRTDHTDNFTDLRNDNDYYIPRYRTDMISRMPLFNLPKLWNLYSPELADTHNKHIHSKAVTLNFLEKLNSILTCNRLVCPSCISNNVDNNAIVN
jgi:hypothetical protein